MKESDWARWRFLSAESLALDKNLQACDCVARGWYNCDCERKDFSKWDKDFLFQRKFSFLNNDWYFEANMLVSSNTIVTFPCA